MATRVVTTSQLFSYPGARTGNMWLHMLIRADCHRDIDLPCESDILFLPSLCTTLFGAKFFRLRQLSHLDQHSCGHTWEICSSPSMWMSSPAVRSLAWPIQLVWLRMSISAGITYSCLFISVSVNMRESGWAECTQVCVDGKVKLTGRGTVSIASLVWTPSIRFVCSDLYGCLFLTNVSLFRLDDDRSSLSGFVVPLAWRLWMWITRCHFSSHKLGWTVLWIS